VAKLIRHSAKQVGLSPGTMVHVGEQRQGAARLELIEYAPDRLERRPLADLDACYRCPPAPAVAWFNLDGLADTALLGRFGDCFGIHPLVLEDIVNTGQRPKAEEYDSYLYLVLKMFSPHNSDGFKGEQVSFVLGANWLLTFQEGLDGDLFAPVRERLKNEQGRLRNNGPDYLAYALIDVIVDNYFVLLEQIADGIEELETELMDNPSQETLQRIHRRKRQLLYLHKAIWPLREVISAMIRRESTLVKDETLVYLRDLYDHTVQVIEMVETLREMLGGMLDIYLSSVSNRMNGIMKVLTVIATIFMPLTFIVGVYGMNFKNMPELELRWGYPMIWLVMIAIAGGLVRFFSRKGWL